MTKREDCWTLDHCWDDQAFTWSSIDERNELPYDPKPLTDRFALARCAGALATPETGALSVYHNGFSIPTWPSLDNGLYGPSTSCMIHQPIHPAGMEWLCGLPGVSGCQGMDTFSSMVCEDLANLPWDNTQGTEWLFSRSRSEYPYDDYSDSDSAAVFHLQQRCGYSADASCDKISHADTHFQLNNRPSAYCLRDGADSLQPPFNYTDMFHHDFGSAGFGSWQAKNQDAADCLLSLDCQSVMQAWDSIGCSQDNYRNSESYECCVDDGSFFHAAQQLKCVNVDPESTSKLDNPSMIEESNASIEPRNCRSDQLRRYREKKLKRKFSTGVRYKLRKDNADIRPRIQGRFIKGKCHGASIDA